MDAQQAALYPPSEGMEQHKLPDSKVQGILLCKVTTGFLGGCAAETAPLPHSKKGNTDFYLGIFPHVYQPDFDLKVTELLVALYGCKTKQSATLGPTQPSLKRGLTVSHYYAETPHCACHNGILPSCRTHPIKYSKTLLEEIQ